MVSTPSPPDPYVTAAAQTKSNKDTAQYQSEINMVNQTTPYGTVNYQQTGTRADGSPIYSATTALTQPMQNYIDSQMANSTKASGLTSQAMDIAQQRLNQGLPNAPNLPSAPNLSDYSSVQGNLDRMARNVLDPQWGALQDKTQGQLAAQGLAPGSEGYTAQMNTFNNQRQSAYDQYYLSNQQQAANQMQQQYQDEYQNAQQQFQNEMQLYNQPFNEISALNGNTQISQPSVGQTAQVPQTGVAGTDIAGLIQQNYQSQLQASNAAMGGLFGLGGSAISGLALF